MVKKLEKESLLKKSKGPFIIGITGGSGCGKSTFAKKLIQEISPESAILIHQDSYYHDLKFLSLVERSRQNFDDPSAIENELLIRHLEKLKSGESIEVPVYDFQSHLRTGAKTFHPAPIILVEGILLLCHRRLGNMMDYSIFIDTEADLRFIRRLRRDLDYRGRDINSIIQQYLTSVRPSYRKWVEPARELADLVISGNESFSQSVKEITRFIKERIL
jgi:uridine kinase